MTQLSHFKIGLFFLLSVLAITVGMFWIGAHNIFQEYARYVTYINTSVQGLNAGSSVHFQGLKVGQIESLELAPANQDLVQVVISLKPSFHVDQDMVVTKAMKGVTGQAFLSITRKVPEDVRQKTPDIDFDPPHPLIPSIPGRINRLEEALSELYHKAKSLNVDKLLSEWKAVAVNTRKALDEEQINSTLQTMNTAFEDISRVSGQMQDIAAPLANGSLQATLEDLRASSESMRRITSSLEGRLSELEPGSVAAVAEDLSQTLDRVDSSVQSVNTRIEKSLRFFQQGMIRLDQVLNEIKNLARSLRMAPDRILNQSQERKPFEE